MTGGAEEPRKSVVPPDPDEPLAERLRGFGPIGLLAFLAIAAGNSLVSPLSAILVLLWARLSRTPWSEIGFARPRSWIRALAVGIPAGIALKLVMKAVVMPLLDAPPSTRGTSTSPATPRLFR